MYFKIFKTMKKNFLLFVAVLSFSMMTSQSKSEKDPEFNVLFIAVDDLNDYVSLLQDHPGLKTPNLDKFAQSAITFTNAYTAAPACNPSRSAILTGIKPSVSGLYENRDSFQKSEEAMASVLMPEHFKNNGYRTMWSGKLFHTGDLNSSRPGEERMEAMWDDQKGSDGGYGPFPKENTLYEGNKWFSYEEWEGPDRDFPDTRNADLTIKRLQEKHDKPFFMAYGIYRPHTPWTAPKRFFEMYPIEEVKLPEVLENDLDDVPSTGKKWAARGVDLEKLKETKKWKHSVRAYLASISFMDYNLGRVLEALEKSPYRDNTIVVLWADHGFHMGEKNHFTKFALWEQTTHTLLMARIPGFTDKGGERSQPVNLLDIYPTLVDYCNLPPLADQLDGISMRPVIEDGCYKVEKPSITYYVEGSVGMRTEKWRYIHYANGEEELYNSIEDPKEWNNLAGKPEYTEVINRFQKWVPKDAAPHAGK